VHLGVPRAGALGQPASATGRDGGLRLRHGRGRLLLGLGWLGLVRGGGAQAVVVRGHGFLRRLAQVLPQVEAVGNLDRLRGPGAYAV
jgi:hypothetical protein